MDGYRPVDFEKYLSEKKLKNITLKDLNEIISEQGTEVLKFANFSQIYSIVSQRESNKTINNLTRVILGMTFVMTVFTVLMYFK